MQGLGGTGAQQAKDCSFPAGSVAGAPLRVSWFLVIFFVYQLIDALNNRNLPVWYRVAQVVAYELLLLLTVLCHEMGHGTMARRRGGDISEVLLWPFGGICFTTRPSGRDSREKLIDDLWIVGAGPATHFPMVGLWLAFIAILASVCDHVALPPAWHHAVPFASVGPSCVGGGPTCFHSYGGLLLYSCLVQAVKLNVMLFLFNVFFPMYPMDGAKLIVCSLQLFCRVSARCAAKVLIYTSTPLALIFIGSSLKGMGNGGGLQPGITLFMGIMCLAESYKIWSLMKDGRLYTHPLFELARSSTVNVSDPMGFSVRLNSADHDDEEPIASNVQITEVRPFEGSGRKLSGEAAAMANPADHPDAAAGAAAGGAGSAGQGQGRGGRSAWLDRVEREATERGKSVRQLEDERLERLERERLNGPARSHAPRA